MAHVTVHPFQQRGRLEFGAYLKGYESPLCVCRTPLEALVEGEQWLRCYGAGVGPIEYLTCSDHTADPLGLGLPIELLDLRDAVLAQAESEAMMLSIGPFELTSPRA